ncbi:hypothetical protein [Mesorhizobium abyssinicae]|uniref:hypothetical protein n=1 Tax=Mesorhizobium abyssinicae TaxID=1209958 RepID=UPI003397996B
MQLVDFEICVGADIAGMTVTLENGSGDFAKRICTASCPHANGAYRAELEA